MTTATSALDDLVAAVRTAQRSVFRLEARQDYPSDALWQAHLRGEDWESDPSLADWCALVSTTVARDATWIRARVVIEPWTPYSRWEIGQHFPHNLDAGEDIRLVRAGGAWPVDDFWLVDDARAWRLHYGPDGAMTVDEVAPEELWKARGWRDHALSLAVPLRVSAST